MEMCHFYGISAHCGQLSVSYNVQNLVNLKKVHKIDPFWPKEGSHKIECQILHLYDFSMACFHLGFEVTNKIMLCTSKTKQVISFLPIPAKCIVFNFTLSDWENRLPALCQLTASYSSPCTCINAILSLFFMLARWFIYKNIVRRFLSPPTASLRIDMACFGIKWTC